LLPTIITAASLVLTSIVLLPSTVTSYIAPEASQKVEVVDMSVSAIIKRSATKYGVSEATMRRVVECESKFHETTQSRNQYKHDHPEWGVKKGDYEKSFGLVQIHLPHHPNITYEQAIDPEFAADFLAKNLSEGRGKLWSCY